MNKIDLTDTSELGELPFAGDAEAALAASPLVPLLPLLRPVSGLYETSLMLQQPQPIPSSIPNVPPQPGPGPLVPGLPNVEDEPAEDSRGAVSPLLLSLRREQLRLDVDNLYPQRTASGTLYGSRAPILHWIASLAKRTTNTWSGGIWYKDGNTSSFPYTNVTIKVTRSTLGPASATVIYSGGGAAPLVRTLPYKSPYLRNINLEFDYAQGSTPVLDIQTHAHPNRPATLTNETLSIQTVFRRAGFRVVTNAPNPVPLARAGANARWSDQEMHDAMQVYWSRFSNAPKWAFWTFFASLHDDGSSLGGIMFDDIGPNHRQGTAIFLDAFIATAPAGDPAPAAWVRRMRFWTAVHEMGHTFNLAHSWQKSLGTPWATLADEPEARSFMNYPYRVAGGQAAFFANFAYRFSDKELLFLRHAPERFVRQGDAAWFDHHGFQQDLVAAEPTFALELRPPRRDAKFEFLEPIVIDLKLTNITDEPQLVDERLLADADEMTVIIKRKGKAAREYRPFSRRCYQQRAKALAPGQSITESLFVSVGLNGWDLAEPGDYMVQIALHLDEEDIISAPLALRVERPRSYDEENFATDFFSEDVGRVLAFDGSRTLDRACDTLHEATDMLKNRRVAVHAHVALGSAKARNAKVLDLREVAPGDVRSAATAGAKLQIAAADEKEAREHLEVLTKDPNVADQTLGHNDYVYYLDQHGDLLGSRSTQARLLEIVAKGAGAPHLPAVAAALPRRGATSRGSRALARTAK